MKLIKPSFEIISQAPSELGMLKHIETCGRVAWKSEERITDDSYVKFIEMLKGVNHGSVLEHGTVYMLMPCTTRFSGSICFYNNNQYTKVVDCKIGNDYFYAITTNYRVLIDGQDNLFTDVWQDLEELQCEPTEFHEKRVTVRFTCDRGVSHEYIRHRVFSFTQESTRYCNYSKDKFDNEVTFILPGWVNRDERYDFALDSILCVNSTESPEVLWVRNLVTAEQDYIQLLRKGWKPQQARTVLPNSLKTELIMTGFISDWEHFFKLRTASGAHPQASELAIPLQEEFKKLNFI